MRALKVAVAVGTLLLALPVAVLADVTVERYTKSGGFRGIGASEGTSVDRISGLKKREKGTMKMTGTLGSFFSKVAGDMETDAITDIPADAVRRLDNKKKTYTESAITLPKEKEGAEKQAAAGKEGPPEKQKVRVVRNEITVKETGEKKVINGFDCARFIITWLVETENIETGERAKNIMTNDLWNTPETKDIRALQQEEMEFTQAYLKKLGLDITSQETKKLGLSFVAGMLGGDEKSMEGNVREIQEKMSKVKGYPIATSVKWEVIGEAKATPPPAEGGGSGGGQSGGLDISKGIGGLLSGLAKKAATPKTDGAPPREGNVVFDTYVEVKRIDASPIAAGEFEVPAGYKLVK
jgi:hypothetical protein